MLHHVPHTIISSVIINLPSILEEDDKPPCKMSDIDDGEKKEKEATLFDAAMKTVVSKY